MSRTMAIVLGVVSMSSVACSAGVRDGVVKPVVTTVQERVQVGLPNAGSYVYRDERGRDPDQRGGRDAIANGDDACTSGEGSVLRGKYPPCPSFEKTRKDFGFTERAPVVQSAPIAVPLRVDRARAWPCLDNPEPALAMAPQPLGVLPVSCSLQPR